MATQDACDATEDRSDVDVKRDQERQFRVATLNLWGDRAPLFTRLQLAASGLGARAVDAVLLQEVRCGNRLANTAETLATLMGADFRAHYACATAGPAGTWGPGSEAGEEGLAIVSRHPVLQRKTLELPDARPSERRIVLSVQLGFEHAWVWCHTTHLHWRKQDGAARLRQAAAICDYVRTLDGAQVVAGDFNAEPDSPEIASMTAADAGLVDLWTLFHSTEPGHTWSEKNPNTLPLSHLGKNRRVDYVFYRPSKHASATSCVLALDEPNSDDVWPSDHFSLVAELALS